MSCVHGFPERSYRHCHLYRKTLTKFRVTAHGSVTQKNNPGLHTAKKNLCFFCFLLFKMNHGRKDRNYTDALPFLSRNYKDKSTFTVTALERDAHSIGAQNFPFPTVRACATLPGRIPLSRPTAVPSALRHPDPEAGCKQRGQIWRRLSKRPNSFLLRGCPEFLDLKPDLDARANKLN